MVKQIEVKKADVFIDGVQYVEMYLNEDLDSFHVDMSIGMLYAMFLAGWVNKRCECFDSGGAGEGAAQCVLPYDHKSNEAGDHYAVRSKVGFYFPTPERNQWMGKGVDMQGGGSEQSTTRNVSIPA